MCVSDRVCISDHNVYVSNGFRTVSALSCPPSTELARASAQRMAGVSCLGEAAAARGAIPLHGFLHGAVEGHRGTRSKVTTPHYPPQVIWRVFSPTKRLPASAVASQSVSTLRMDSTQRALKVEPQQAPPIVSTSFITDTLSGGRQGNWHKT